MQLGEPRTYKQLVLQNDYNGKRFGESDNWGWSDTSYRPKRPGTGTREEQIEDLKQHALRSQSSKFIRGWRIVERTTVTTDELVEEIPVNG